jgi:hypothetical protein
MKLGALENQAQRPPKWLPEASQRPKGALGALWGWCFWAGLHLPPSPNTTQLIASLDYNAPRSCLALSVTWLARGRKAQCNPRACHRWLFGVYVCGVCVRMRVRVHACAFLVLVCYCARLRMLGSWLRALCPCFRMLACACLSCHVLACCLQVPAVCLP